MAEITMSHSIDREAVTELVHQLRILNRTIEDLEAERDAIKDLLKEQMGDLQELRGEDYKILYTPVQQERIDSKKLRATYPEIAAEVTKTVSYRRFEVK